MVKRPNTKQRLMDAAFQIIINEGIDDCSIEAICAQAGFTRGAFYSNFGTKDDLLAALTEREYKNLIFILQTQVKEWSKAPVVESTHGSRALMESLLFEALNSISFGRRLYIFHSDILTRCIRTPDWGNQFLELNSQFVKELGRLLKQILEISGRDLAIPIQPLTHAIIGIAIRAAGIEGWYCALMNTPEYRTLQRKRALGRKQISTLVSPPSLAKDPLLNSASHHLSVGLTTSTTATVHCSANSQSPTDNNSSLASYPETNVADSPARGIVEMIVVLLFGASNPKDSGVKSVQG